MCCDNYNLSWWASHRRSFWWFIERGWDGAPQQIQCWLEIQRRDLILCIIRFSGAAAVCCTACTYPLDMMCVRVWVRSWRHLFSSKGRDVRLSCCDRVHLSYHMNMIPLTKLNRFLGYMQVPRSWDSTSAAMLSYRCCTCMLVCRVLSTAPWHRHWYHVKDPCSCLCIHYIDYICLFWMEQTNNSIRRNTHERQDGRFFTWLVLVSWATTIVVVGLTGMDLSGIFNIPLFSVFYEFSVLLFSSWCLIAAVTAVVLYTKTDHMLLCYEYRCTKIKNGSTEQQYMHVQQPYVKLRDEDHHLCLCVRTLMGSKMVLRLMFGFASLLVMLAHISNNSSTVPRTGYYLQYMSYINGIKRTRIQVLAI